MYRSRHFPFRTCRRLVSSGHRRSLVTWGGASRNWRGCVQRPSSISIRVDRVVVSTVAYGLSATCIGMWRGSIWTWHCCGGAQCRGAPCGRARPKTVWITLGGRMMFRGKLSQPALNIFFRRGQSHVRCG